MSSASSSGNELRPKTLSSDVELNIAPIVDCFTVLIAYMLAAASFVSLGALEAKIASQVVGEGSGAAVPQVILSFELRPNHEIQVKVQGPSNEVIKVNESSSQAWNWEAAVAAVQQFKMKYPAADQVVVLADNTIQYLDLVTAADQLRKVLPVVITGSETL